MPSESKTILKWVAIGTFLLAVIGGTIQGLAMVYWFGAKVEAKADRLDVPTLEEFHNLEDDFNIHSVTQAEITGQVTAQLKAQGRQLDRIESRVISLHENGGP